MVVKTFRGLLTDGGQDQLRLSTIKGKAGYRIVKLQIIGAEPGEQHAEHTVKIYKEQQATVNNAVNFSDNKLLGVAFYQDAHDLYTDSIQIIFDGEIFNQDVYVTHEDTRGAQPCNYYIELEVVPLTDQGAEYTTLKDIRTQS